MVSYFCLLTQDINNLILYSNNETYIRIPLGGLFYRCKKNPCRQASTQLINSTLKIHHISGPAAQYSRKINKYYHYTEVSPKLILTACQF